MFFVAEYRQIILITRTSSRKAHVAKAWAVHACCYEGLLGGNRATNKHRTVPPFSIIVYMKKNIIIFLSILLTIAVDSIGQTNFKIEAPTFQKIVIVTGTNVNIRKSANVKSSRVDIANNGDALAVVGESGDWYKVCNSHWIAPYADEGGNATMQITTVGFIMKRFCKDANLLSATQDAYGFYVVPSGRHKGVCLWYSYNGHEEDWYGLTFAIGKQVGNMYILPYRIGVNEYGEPTDRVIIKRDGNAFKLELKNEILDGNEINLNKLTDTDIDYLIANVSKMSKKSGRIIFFTGGSEYQDINYGEGLNQLTLTKY